MNSRQLLRFAAHKKPKANKDHCKVANSQTPTVMNARKRKRGKPDLSADKDAGKCDPQPRQRKKQVTIKRDTTDLGADQEAETKRKKVVATQSDEVTDLAGGSANKVKTSVQTNSKFIIADAQCEQNEPAIKFYNCVVSHSEGIDRNETHNSAEIKPHKTADVSNVQVVRVLRSSDIPVYRKIEMALQYVEMQEQKVDSLEKSVESMPMLQFVSFLFEWIKSEMVFSTKHGSIYEKPSNDPASNEAKEHALAAYMDQRGWKIMKWCLISGYLSRHITVSSNLIRAITAVLALVRAIIWSEGPSTEAVKFFFPGGCSPSTPYEIIVSISGASFFVTLEEVLQILFQEYGRTFRPSLVDWTLLMSTSLGIMPPHAQGLSILGYFDKPLYNIIVLMSEQFVEYVTVYTNPRATFQAIVEKLLEPLLTALGHLEQSQHVANMQKQRLLKAIQGILENGLFSGTHVEGYLDGIGNGRGNENDNNDTEVEGKSKSFPLVSYHRLFFSKIRDIREKGNYVALHVVGHVLKLFHQKFLSHKSLQCDDVFGVKGRGKKRKSEAEEISSSSTPNEQEVLPETMVGVTDVSIDKIKEEKFSETGHRLFSFFMELTLPVLNDVERCLSCIHQTEANNDLLDSLSSIKDLLAASNSLFIAAQQLHMYNPTKDTSLEAHLRFLKQFCTILMDIGKSIPQIYHESCSRVKSGHPVKDLPCKLKDVISTLLREVICGVGCVLELDYHVVEDHLESMWHILLSAVIVKSEQTTMTHSLTSEAIQLGCRIMHTFSDLRNVHRPLLTISSSLKKLLQYSSSSQPDNPFIFFLLDANMSSKMDEKVVTDLFCATPFIKAIKTSITSMPEGQAAQLLNVLATDVSETSQVIGNKIILEDGGIDSASIGRRQVLAKAAVNALVEVCASVLENINATSSNCVQVGKSVRWLVESALSRTLSELLTDYVLNKPDSYGGRAKNQQQWKTLQTYFLLRLFLSCRILHRQCVSLMPLVKAKEASKMAHDILLDPSNSDWIDIAAKMADAGFFVWIEKGHVEVSALVAALNPFEDHLPALRHVMDCVIVQRLCDLNDYIKCLKFFEFRVAPLDESDPLLQMGNSDTQIHDSFDAKTLNKLLHKMEKEAAVLCKYLFNDNGLQQKTSFDVWLQNWFSLAKRDSLCLNSGKTFFLEERSSGIWNGVVSTLTLKTLHIAKWYLLCQTLDIWSKHVSRKELVNFLRLLLRTLQHINSSNVDYTVMDGKGDYLSSRKISQELIEDLSFYENKPMRGAFISAILKEISSILYVKVKNVDFQNPVPDIHRSGKVNTAHHILNIQKKLPKPEELDGCINLLNLLALLPRGYVKCKDVTKCIHHIWTVERFSVEMLLLETGVHSTSDACKLESIVPAYIPRLYASMALCRKAIQTLILSLTENELFDGNASIVNMFCKGPMSWKWLLGSTRIFSSFFIGMNHVDFGDGIETSKMQKLANMFLNAILKHTQGIVTVVSNYAMSWESRSFLHDVGMKDNPVLPNERESLNQRVLHCHSMYVESILDEIPDFAMHISPEALKGASDASPSDGWFKALSSMLAVSSILWSMTMAVEKLDKQCHQQASKGLRWFGSLPKQWLDCFDRFDSLLTEILMKHIVPIEDEQKILDVFAISEVRGLEQKEKDNELDRYGHATESLGNKDDDDNEAEGEVGVVETDSDGEMTVPQLHGPACIDDDKEMENNGFHFMDLSSMQQLVLKAFLERSSRQQSEFLGEFFRAIAALMKVKSLLLSPYAVPSKLDEKVMSMSVNVTLGSVSWILGKATELVLAADNIPMLLWLPGVVKCMESSGSLLSCIDPPLASLDYIKLVNLHVCLLGALAVPSDFENMGHLGNGLVKMTLEACHEIKHVNKRRCFEQLNAAVRRSFEALVHRAPRRHLVLVLQSIERAISGVWEGFSGDTSLKLGSSASGRIHNVVASGVICMSILLEGISGRWRLGLLASYCPLLVAALLNMVEHAQGPALLLAGYRSSQSGIGNLMLDAVNSEPVVLQSLDILTKLMARDIIFPMKSNHIAFALQCPASLFRSFYQHRIQTRIIIRKFYSNNAEACPSILFGMDAGGGDILIKLYAASCRLLCAVLRHRTRKSGRCISLLGDSNRVLLYCLECMDQTDTRSEKDGIGVWNVKTAIQCAHWLRRVYEQVSEHRDTFGKYCNHLLSDYLSVVSGCGPLGAGLKREVERELQPGAFALVDACSPSELQQLHASIGEGPMRSNFIALRRDYESKFKYTGKI